MHVCTYICKVKLEHALQTENFSSQHHKAGLNILYTAWWLKTQLSKELKNFSLTHEQYNVMRILKGKHPDQMCVKDIGCRMIEKSSNVPRIIDRLVAKGLVVRNNSDKDKRETVMTLTDAGLSLLSQATNKLNKTLIEVGWLKEEESMKLNELLEKFREKE